MTVPANAPAGAPVTVQDALYAALVADAGLASWLRASETTAPGDRRVYEGLAPDGTALSASDGSAWPYLTLQGGDEAPLNTGGRRGFDVALTVRAWVPGNAPRLAHVGAAHVRRILDGATLTLSAFVAVSTTVGTVRTQPDPDGLALQAIVPVSTFAQVAG